MDGWLQDTQRSFGLGSGESQQMSCVRSVWNYLARGGGKQYKVMFLHRAKAFDIIQYEVIQESRRWGSAPGESKETVISLNDGLEISLWSERASSVCVRRACPLIPQVCLVTLFTMWCDMFKRSGGERLGGVVRANPSTHRVEGGA